MNTRDISDRRTIRATKSLAKKLSTQLITLAHCVLGIGASITGDTALLTLLGERQSQFQFIFCATSTDTLIGSFNPQGIPLGNPDRVA